MSETVIIAINTVSNHVQFLVLAVEMGETDWLATFLPPP
jgi:hypothetical protein